MALDPKHRPPKRERGSPTAFRFSQDSIQKLKVIAKAYGWTQVEIVEELIDREYEQARKEHPSVFRKLRSTR